MKFTWKDYLKVLITGLIMTLSALVAIEYSKPLGFLMLWGWLSSMLAVTTVQAMRCSVFEKKKELISGHETEITIMYLTEAINNLETKLSAYPSSDTDFGNWAIIHDIKCLKIAIKYLE